MKQRISSLDCFINEANNEVFFYKVFFKNNYTIDGNNQSPIWVLMTSKEWNMIAKKGAVEKIGGYGEQKSEDRIKQKLQWEFEHGDKDAKFDNVKTFDELNAIILKLKK